jgi:hypothetical protein
MAGLIVVEEAGPFLLTWGMLFCKLWEEQVCMWGTCQSLSLFFPIKESDGAQNNKSSWYRRKLILRNVASRKYELMYRWSFEEDMSMRAVERERYLPFRSERINTRTNWIVAGLLWQLHENCRNWNCRGFWRKLATTEVSACRNCEHREMTLLPGDYLNYCFKSVFIIKSLYCNGFAQSIKQWSLKSALLGKHVQTNTRLIQKRCFLCNSRRDSCLVADSAPMDWLVSDHVGTPTDRNATIE